eukprot:TRINITY_DN37016_c0_g1_i1.p1 TRINITY_DN37016_c0_g1~~TRINITY_DN37016_c0_g1_i1.p1  ORF type:complete len:828 (+),score=147.47 TRINITY_DN37016_c0_g1_i1:59-2485(+)
MPPPCPPPPSPPVPVDQEAQAAGAVAAGAALASASVLSATQGSRMKKFMQVSRCPPDTDSQDMDFLDSPTGMGRRGRSMKRHQMAQRREMLLGNLVLVLGVPTVHFGCAIGIHVMRRHKWAGEASWDRSMAVARFPSFSVFPLLVLAQPLCTPALTLLYNASEVMWYDIVLSICTILFLFAAAYAVWWVLRKERFAATLVRDVEIRGCKRWLLGDKHWTSLHTDDNYERRYALLFRDFKVRTRWFLLVDLLVLFLISVISSWTPSTDTQCAGQAVLMAVVEISFIMVVIWLRPFIVRVDHFLAILVTCLQVIGLLFALSAIFGAPSIFQTLSRFALLVASCLIAFKALFDLAVWLRDQRHSWLWRKVHSKAVVTKSNTQEWADTLLGYNKGTGSYDNPLAEQVRKLPRIFPGSPRMTSPRMAPAQPRRASVPEDEVRSPLDDDGVSDFDVQSPALQQGYVGPLPPTRRKRRPGESSAPSTPCRESRTGLDSGRMAFPPGPGSDDRDRHCSHAASSASPLRRYSSHASTLSMQSSSPMQTFRGPMPPRPRVHTQDDEDDSNSDLGVTGFVEVEHEQGGNVSTVSSLQCGVNSGLTTGLDSGQGSASLTDVRPTPSRSDAGLSPGRRVPRPRRPTRLDRPRRPSSEPTANGEGTPRENPMLGSSPAAGRGSRVRLPIMRAVHMQATAGDCERLPAELSQGRGSAVRISAQRQGVPLSPRGGAAVRVANTGARRLRTRTMGTEPGPPSGPVPPGQSQTVPAPRRRSPSPPAGSATPSQQSRRRAKTGRYNSGNAGSSFKRLPATGAPPLLQ